jgi:TonB-linked SusC/RagA family outer membrane protein
MLLLTCLFIGIGLVTAQVTKITGVVTSEEDGLPVVGASVLVKGTTVGTVTDMDGKFALNNVPSSAKTLVVSFIGMQTQEVGIKPQLKIILKSDSEVLDEVMVVAFGTAKKSAFTGSAKVVGTEQLAQSQVTSVTNALAGAVPGVQLTSSNGAPGASSSIKIRGFSSLNAGNDPLIIVDGAPYSGDLSNLNPSDVESMTVLKDAASNALYGARGANGVIIITTKKAKQSGDATITFDAKVGANSRALQHYNTISDPAQYYEMHYGALKDYYLSQGLTAEAAWLKANNNLCGDQGNGGLGYNIFTVPDGQYLIGQNGKLNPNATLGNIVSYKGEDYLITPDDWENIGTRTGLRQEYNLTISSANEKGSFYTSLGYLDNEGITEASDLKRLTARLKADYQAKKWLKVGGNISYARYDGNSLSNNGSSSSTGNIWAFTTQMAPIYPAYIRNADGSIKIDADGIAMMDYGNGTNAGLARPFLSDANPIQDNKLNTKNYEGNATSGNGFMDFTFIPGLKLTINGTYNLDETRGTYVYNPYYGQFDSTGGTVAKYHTRVYDYNLQQLLNYSTTIAGHNNVEVLLGHEYYDYRYYYLYGSKSKMFSQDNKELDGAVVDGQEASSYQTRRNNEGYFARALYNYDERIFASGSIRRDASSRFAPENRWGTFWSLGAAWLISKEKWFDAPFVDELKLKASIGSQGNDNIGSYRYTDLFTIVNSGGSVGTKFDSKGTRSITWETNTNFNIGAEFELFHKLSGSLEYYYRKTTDMLFSFSVAPSLGYSSYYDNVGDMYNTGVELELSYNVIHNKNIDWTVNANISSLKNKITKLHEDKKTASLYTSGGDEYKGYASDNFFIAEGLSMYTWRLKEYAGVDEKTGLSMWYKKDLDENGNRLTTTSYSDADYFVTKDTSIPDFYGGFGTTLRAYGFDFGINFSYQLGGKQYDGTYASFMSSPTSSNTGYNFHVDLLKSWSTANPNADIPRFQFGDTYSAASSTRFLTNASYLNIENINLGYTFPAKWVRPAAIQSLRLYVSAENVFYWSKRKGFDPRQSYSSTTNSTYYSPMRTISGGITLTF